MMSRRMNTGMSGRPSMVQLSVYVITDAELGRPRLLDAQPLSEARSVFDVEPRSFTCRPFRMSRRWDSLGSQKCIPLAYCPDKRRSKRPLSSSNTTMG